MHRPSTPQGTSNVPPNILASARPADTGAVQAPMRTMPAINASLIAPAFFALSAIGLLVGLALINDINLSSNIVIVIAGILAAIGATAIIAKPHWGAYAFALFIPLNLSDLLTENGLPSVTTPLILLISLALFAHFVFDYDGQKRYFHLKKTELWLMLIGIVEGISLFIAADKSVAWVGIFHNLKNLAILLALTYAIRTPEQWRRMVIFFIVGVTVPSILAVIKFQLSGVAPAFWGIVSGIYQEVDGVYRLRFGGPIRRPNYYGQLLVSALPLVAYRLFESKNRATKTATIVAILTILIGIALTFSRGAIVSLGFVTLLMAFERRAKIGWLLVLGLGVGLAFTFLAPDSYTERARSILTALPSEEGGVEADGSFEGRMSEYMAGLLMFREQPFFGVGKGNYNRNYLDYASRAGFSTHTTERDPHSLYIEMLAEQGLLGFLATFGAFVACASGLQRAYRRIKSVAEYQYLAGWIRSLQFALGTYLFSSIFLHSDYIRFLWLYVAFAVSIMHVSTRVWEDRSIERPFRI